MTDYDLHEEEVVEKPFDARLMVRLLGYLKPYGRWVLFTFVLILIGSVVRQAGPLLTKIAIDDHIVPGDYEGLDRIALIFVGLLALQFALGYAQNFATRMVGQWAMYDVRLQIFSHLQRLPLRFFDRTPIGRLMTRNTNDVDALNELFTDGVVAVFSDIFTLIAIMGYMFWMDPTLALITCVALPPMFVVTFYLQRYAMRAMRRARSRLARLNAYLQENFSGIEVVQLFNRERRNRERFDEHNERYLQANLESTFYYSLYFPIMEWIGAGTVALVLWYGGGQAIEGWIQWGVLIALLQYIPRFFWPILDISERYAILQMAMASSERIFELLDTEMEPEGGDQSPDRIGGEIEFRNVWFAYEGEEWVLRDVSLHVRPGQSVALVGATGSGKSTIISLLCRFYEIQKGQILIDGIDIADWNVESLRRRVSIVQQDVFLFAGDVRTNIRLGNADITDERISQAARDVNADRFIDRLPDRFTHEVNERGSSLSAGQRQLLAFARALAFDPDLLILDEATSSVDTETETWIQEAVSRLMHARTSIVIAHRLSTIRSADKILVIHHGEIREEGTHDELLKTGGIYSRLHELQYIGEEGGSVDTQRTSNGT
ncbi:MAG: ABC transporter ATP-binding protein [Gemmatimonadetes bacterium]|nr:ABC transporter ATP-binding protein [Gemmatimonadota bacterium]